MRKSLYIGNKDFDHRGSQPLGILLLNIGTPDAPTAAALRPYLRKFLSDPRVIEYSRVPWWIILNFFILPFRPKRSAALYEKVWTPEGSPLLIHSKRQLAKLRAHMARTLPVPVEIELGMRIGSPSMESALETLRRKNIKQLLVIPLFPQYSSPTTGTVFDGLADVLKTWRRIPELRMISTFHDDPAYVRALGNSIRDVWQTGGEPEKLVISFHGMPKRYLLDGDPYFCFCQKTARLLCEELGLQADKAIITFQSLFGREEWLRPYTDDVLRELARSGTKSVDVICPAFVADCLETLEEIEEASRHVFLDAGGERFRYIPALNDRDDFIETLGNLIQKNISGWLEPTSEQSGTDVRARRADALRAGNGMDRGRIQER